MRISDWSSDVCSSDLLLMAIIADAREVAGQVETHPLPLVQAVVVGIQPFVEEADVNAKDPRDLEQAAGRHTVDAALVFVSLLIGHAEDRKSTRLNSSH